MKWKIKQIQEDSNIGEQVKKARVAKGLTVYRIANNYKVPRAFMQAVEANDFETLPNTVYTKGMLKKYLRILGLPTDTLLKEWEDAHKNWEALSEEVITEKDIKPDSKPFRKWYITPSLLQKGFVISLSAFLLIYIGVKVDAAIAPTELSVATPHDQMTTAEPAILVVGATEPEVFVTVNQFPVTVESDGTFSQEITLQPGLNVLEIEATKKYRPTQKILRHVLLTQNTTN